MTNRRKNLYKMEKKKRIDKNYTPIHPIKQETKESQYRKLIINNHKVTYYLLHPL